MLLGNLEEEDDSFYVSLAPIDQNLSRDKFTQQAGRVRDEIAQAMWERLC